MLLELKCNSCNTGDLVLDQEPNILICKNPSCDYFNCAIDVSDVAANISRDISKYIVNSLSKEWEFYDYVPNDAQSVIEKKIKEVYKNGILISSEVV